MNAHTADSSKTLHAEWLVDGARWWRIASADWHNPLDSSFSSSAGGRWNPPGAFETLYLNEDVVTARINLRLFIAQWPYEPEDLRDDTGPVLVGATLPRRQRVCDAHSRRGIAAAGLPATYPLDRAGRVLPHARCQSVGTRARAIGLRGVRCRSAQAPLGAGRELAWFPATRRSVARLIERISFERWFWG